MAADGGERNFVMLDAYFWQQHFVDVLEQVGEHCFSKAPLLENDQGSRDVP
jgi:hypothetical protein